MHKDVVTRFAPSPTGRLHLGHAWSALLAHDRARESGGRFLLRIEDIDQGRCRAEFVQGIVEDLCWLGLGWDGEPMIQSERMPAYAEALARLEAQGLLYRCVCTRADIAAAASAPQGEIGALCPGTCRKKHIGPGIDRPWSWRLDTARAARKAGALFLRDESAGETRAKPEIQGDPVLARKDAGTSYHLAVVVDDAAQGITHVVRGRDLLAATHLHRLLQALLGLPTPLYCHHRLVVGTDGIRLAKRRDATTIAGLRDAGTDPVQLVRNLRRNRFPVGFALADA